MKVDYIKKNESFKTNLLLSIKILPELWGNDEIIIGICSLVNQGWESIEILWLIQLGKPTYMLEEHIRAKE